MKQEKMHNIFKEVSGLKEIPEGYYFDKEGGWDSFRSKYFEIQSLEKKLNPGMTIMNAAAAVFFVLLSFTFLMFSNRAHKGESYKSTASGKTIKPGNKIMYAVRAINKPRRVDLDSKQFSCVINKKLISYCSTRAKYKMDCLRNDQCSIIKEGNPHSVDLMHLISSKGLDFSTYCIVLEDSASQSLTINPSETNTHYIIFEPNIRDKFSTVLLTVNANNTSLGRISIIHVLNVDSSQILLKSITPIIAECSSISGYCNSDSSGRLSIELPDSFNFRKASLLVEADGQSWEVFLKHSRDIRNNQIVLTNRPPNRMLRWELRIVDDSRRKLWRPNGKRH